MSYLPDDPSGWYDSRSSEATQLSSLKLLLVTERHTPWVKLSVLWTHLLEVKVRDNILSGSHEERNQLSPMDPESKALVKTCNSRLGSSEGNPENITPLKLHSEEGVSLSSATGLVPIG